MSAPPSTVDILTRMRPEDLPLLNSVSAPAVAPDGSWAAVSVTHPDLDADAYVDVFRTFTTYEDSMYGLPVDGESTALFYRTDLFEEAGIDGPPETWDEFEQTA